MDTYKDNQERIDAYLRGEMDAQSRIQFEKDLETDSVLKTDYLHTKAISEALANRQEKLSKMARWEKEEGRRQATLRKRNIRRWTIAASTAACVAVGFFAILPTLKTTSSAPHPNYAIPDAGEQVYYRGGDSSMEYLDSLIAVKDYEKALAYVDSLIIDNEHELKKYERKDSLTDKEKYNKKLCENNFDDLEWRKVNLLLALGKIDKARTHLKSISHRDNVYKQKADSLLKTITNK